MVILQAPACVTGLNQTIRFNMFSTQPRNCALIGSIPSGIFSGDGTPLPGLGRGMPGKPGAPIDGTKLVGHFDPNNTGTVVGAEYKNLVVGQEHLNIRNGMSYTTGFVDGRGFWSETSGTDLFRLTRYFEADGTDDFLGPLDATNYGDAETGLALNFEGSWTVCMWVNFAEQAWNDSGSMMFSCGPQQPSLNWGGVAAYAFQTGYNYDFGEQASSVSSKTYIKTIEKERWYFVAYEQNGARNIENTAESWTIAVDGKIQGTKSDNGPFELNGENDPIYIGAKYSQYEVETDVYERNYEYAQSGTKFGKIMIYSGNIGINRIIQNYMATREDYNRHSGEKNQYFVENPNDTYAI